MQGPSTRSIHADRDLAELPDVAPAIRPSTTFTDGTGRRYRRASHETTERLERVVGALEGGHAVAYSSGMAAVAAVLDHVNPRRISLPDDCYHGVRDLVSRRVAQGAVELVGPDLLDEGDVWWVETPSNPFCLVTDLADVTARAHAAGALVVCDATFATPHCLHALEFDVDVVMHSATKAISGHSDAVLGLLVVDDPDTAEHLRSARALLGSVPGSLDSWLALRGVRTLPLRVQRAASTAATVAAWFDRHGVRTWYPGLARHPGHDIARSQMSGFGSMLSIDLDDRETAARFVGSLAIWTNATSLGGVESLVEHRVLSDPSVPPGLVRLSVGIEDPDDLVDDLQRALADLR